MEARVTTGTSEAISSRATASEATRWGQLIFGIICMVMIANLQYGWTLFVNPIDQKYHWGRAAIQVAFTIFVLTETWLVPIEGYLIDKFGPRIMISLSGALIGIAWIINSYADSLFLLYLGAAVGGIGAGVVYGGTIGNALKWFPDHRGLCVGLTSGAYGIGTALTVAPIASMMKASGYQHTLITWGMIQGIVVVLAALVLATPPAGWAPPGWKVKEAQAKPKVRVSSVDMTPWQMLHTGSFWVIYLMMTLVAFGGLVVTAQLNPMAVSYRVDRVLVAFGMTALVR